MIRKTRRVIGAAALATLVLAGWARADALEQVPAETLFVVKVSKMSDLSNKVGKLMTDWGVVEFNPKAATPLANIREEFKIEKGLKDDGDVALGMLSPKSFNIDENDATLIILPVTDYKEFISNFEGATTEGDITTARIGQSEKDYFIVNRGGYAVIAETKSVLEKKFEKFIKIEGLALKEIQRHDAVVYANMPVINEEVKEGFAKGRESALAEIEKNFADEGNEAYTPLAKVALTQVFKVGEVMLRDSTGATLGVTIGENGITSTIVADFKPGSYMGKMVSGLKSTDAQLIKGLPEHRYVYYAGSAYDPAIIKKAVNDFSEPILGELGKIDNKDVQEVTRLVGEMNNAIGKNKGSVAGLIIPEDITKDALLSQVAVYNGGGKETSDFFDAIGQFAPDAIKRLSEKQAKDAGGDATPPEFKVTFNDKYKTISDVTFHRIGFESPMPKDNPMLPQMMKIMYGADGPGMTYGVMGDQMFYYGGLSDESVAKFIAAAKAGDDSLAKNPLRLGVAGQLPKERWAEIYVYPDEFINLVVLGVNQFMPGVFNMELPTDLAPIGTTIGTDGNALRVDTYVPTKTVSQIVSAIIQQMNNMKAGRRGGGAL